MLARGLFGGANHSGPNLPVLCEPSSQETCKCDRRQGLGVGGCFSTCPCATPPFLAPRSWAHPVTHLRLSVRLSFRCCLWEPVLLRRLILRHTILALLHGAFSYRTPGPALFPRQARLNSTFSLLMVPVCRLPALNSCRAGVSALCYAPRTRGTLGIPATVRASRAHR